MAVDSRDLRTYVTQVGFQQEAMDKQLPIITEMGEIGIGSGLLADEVSPSLQTALIGEIARYPINRVYVDPDNPDVLIAEALIPAGSGGWVINEAGVFTTTGTLYTYARQPGDYKPVLAQGQGQDYFLQLRFKPANVDQIELQIDPSVVLATRTYVDSEISDKQIDKAEQVTVNAGLDHLLYLTSKGLADSVVDSLSSTNAKRAGSANQLRVLNEKIDSLRVGMVTPAPLVNPWAGTLPFHGQELLIADYPRLWAWAQAHCLIVTEAQWASDSWGTFSSGNGSTTFRMPDWRYEFIQGADDGRAIDALFTVGKWKADELKSHTHKHYSHAVNISTSTGAGHYSVSASKGTNTTAAGGAETRSRSLAQRWVIFY